MDRTDQDERMAEVVADQHDHLRGLFHDAAHAAVDDREAACSRLVRYLAVHEAAEIEALHPGEDATDRLAEEIGDLGRRAERLEDLGPRCATWTTQLGLLAAAVDHHVRHGEEDDVPRFVARSASADVARAVATLRSADDLAAESGTDAEVPTDASFVGQLQAARRSIRRGRSRHADGRAGREDRPGRGRRGGVGVSPRRATP